MGLNSINTNIAAYYAQQNIGKASTMSSLSVARLSSGSRIVRAADDVAALSAGTSLRTAVTTLKTALINTSQGSSLLQVADGALAQITDILQRQKAISIQSGAGSLSDTERGFLNQEFSNLAAEIDRIADSTNFNNVVLLDGSLFDKNIATTAGTAADAATGGFTFKANLVANQTMNVNGVNFTSTATVVNPANTFLIGATTQATIDNLVNAWNASTNALVSQATYSRSGLTLNVTQRSGGVMGEPFTLYTGAASTTIMVNGTLILAGNSTYSLQGAGTTGLGYGSTVATGNIGDTIITTQNQTPARSVLAFPPGTNPVAATTITVNVGGTTSTLSFAAAAAFDSAVIVAGSLTETLDNMVGALNNYANNIASGVTQQEAYVFKQINFYRDGTSIVMESKMPGNVTNEVGTALVIASSVAGVGISQPNLNNSTTTGVTTNGLQNASWSGTISGFQATYTNTPNSVNLSVTVGGIQYTATGVNTAPTAATSVRFFSTTGGFFDVQMAANQGSSVSSQSDANNFAARFDAAFSTLSFFQNRNITSYVGAGDILTNGVQTGSLTGTRFLLRGDDFSEVNITDIRVTAPLSGSTNGIIEFDINGETYRSSGDIGSKLSAYTYTRFTSLSNPNHVLEFRGGAVINQFDTSDEALAFENALKGAFNFGEGGVSLQFQVGTTVDDTLEVTIGSVTTSKIYQGASLDVSTQAGASTASAAIDIAIQMVTSVRAEVGALQSRFNYASANIESSIQNQDAARGVLMDTDVASESTAYATAQVQLQAGIAVLAQANLLPQNLLKLIG